MLGRHTGDALESTRERTGVFSFQSSKPVSSHNWMRRVGALKAPILSTRLVTNVCGIFGRPAASSQRKTVTPIHHIIGCDYQWIQPCTSVWSLAPLGLRLPLN